MDIEIREIQYGELEALLSLYSQLHGEVRPQAGGRLILACLTGGRLIASCAVVIIPNLTRAGSPYALIENVVTHPDFRRRGCATGLLHRACDLAEGAGCYKIMLMTSSKQEGTLRFYENAGFNRGDKTAFVRWARPFAGRPDKGDQP